MSLFGTSPTEAPLSSKLAQSRQSLFDDESTPGLTSQSSLFADEEAPIGVSPWAFGIPKKAARGDLVKTLLESTEVPESYIDTYDELLKQGDKLGAGVSLTGLKKVLAGSELRADDQAKILNVVIPGGHDAASGIGRGVFNVMLALIGLAQEYEDVTLDAVDERRRNLPEPSLPSFTRSTSSKVSDIPEAPLMQPKGASVAPRASAKPAKLPEDDPWASPATRKGNDHAPTNWRTASSNGTQTTLGRDSTEVRNNGAYTTTANGDQSGSPPGQTPPADPPASSGTGWGFPDGDHGDDFANRSSGLGGNGFGDDGNRRDRGVSGSAVGSGRATGLGVEENITVTVLPEKEGMFLFQHRNYQVSSARRGSKVIRRYSDFVWLLDCLHKRYPFRLLPLLPPKRVAVNGNHLSADNAFIEKRRRGLARFTNALVRHPVLNQEQLVVMFLTVPTELAVWRKQATISVQEEFTGKPLPTTLEDSLPPNLSETFETVRSGVRRSAEIYINLCNLLERLTKRNEGVAADYLRFALALQSLVDTTESTYSVDTNDVPLLNEGLSSTAKHMSASQSLLEDEARAWDEGVLEDLKRQRDVLVGMRDMFDRRDRYAKDNIPTLEKRIEANESKLSGLRNKPEGTVKPNEIEKVESAIIKDKQSIVDQHARGVFIKECIRDELNYFQGSQYHVSRLYQDWSQERIKYAELQADNWRRLSEDVEGMPLGD